MLLDVVAVGAFGAAVAERLVGRVGGTVTHLRGDVASIPEQWRAAPLRVLASWRPVPELCASIDAWSAATKAPWLPIVQEPPVVAVGPVVSPGHGPCFACFERRTRQHELTPGLPDALARAYASDASAGARGHLPAHALVVAGLAALVLERFRRDRGQEAGAVRTLDLLTMRVETGRVVGMHGCPRCGLGRDERTRSFQPLEDELQFLHAR